MNAGNAARSAVPLCLEAASQRLELGAVDLFAAIVPDKESAFVGAFEDKPGKVDWAVTMDATQSCVVASTEVVSPLHDGQRLLWR